MPKTVESAMFKTVSIIKLVAGIALYPLLEVTTTAERFLVMV
jgi:hypothetical protein